MPLRTLHFSLPGSSSPFAHPSRQTVFCINPPLHLHDGWRDPKQEERLLNGILRGGPSVALTVKGKASFVDIRSPKCTTPLYSLARQLSAQEAVCGCITKTLRFVKGGPAGDGIGNKENVATFFQSPIRVARIVPFLLLGFGAVFTLQFPALAAPGTSVAAAPSVHRLSEIVTSGWAGLLAGCLHALTGPDHLAALAPLCIGRAKLESAVVGALWGLGHDAGQVIFGLVFLLLKGRLHIELVRAWASRIVGVTLLLIGAVGLKEAQEVPVSVLAVGGSSSADSGRAVESKANSRRLRTFATGLVYGLQPDALIMILPAVALPSRLAGAAYLGMFLLGTIVAMGSYTAFIGSCGQALQKRLPWITHRLTVGSSLIAIAFGICIILGELFGIKFF